MKTKLFITGLALMASTALVSAQHGNGRGCGKCNGTGKGAACADRNNQQATTANKENGSGKCDGTGQGKGKSKNFTDANKNGVCDTYEARKKK